MIIRDTLEETGVFSIYITENGEKGLRRFFEEKPDIIVTDVMMPFMDGFEMIRRIRQTDTLTPVIFLTARSAIKDVVEGFELGPNDYLRKPFGMQELIVRIKALVRKLPPEIKATSLFTIGEYKLDTIAQKLYHRQDEEELSYRETEILKRLCQNLNH